MTKDSTENNILELKIPKRFKNDLDRSTFRFVSSARKFKEEVRKLLQKKNFFDGTENFLLKKKIISEMKWRFDKYLSEFSLEEQQFLIITLCGLKWEYIFYLASLDPLYIDILLENNTYQVKEAWLYYQI